MDSTVKLCLTGLSDLSDSSREDVPECISESHLSFMRSYIARENKTSEAAVARFLALRQKASSGEQKTLGEACSEF
jgi:hypothetical protein